MVRLTNTHFLYERYIYVFYSIETAMNDNILVQQRSFLNCNNRFVNTYKVNALLLGKSGASLIALMGLIYVGNEINYNKFCVGQY